MKIKIINPNTTQSMTDSIYDAALRSADPETEILAVSPKTGPDSIECYVDEYLSVPGVLQEIIKGDREEKADAFIMVPGGIGTFEEFFEVLVLKQLDQLIKPIAVFNVKGYYDSFCRMMDNAESQGFMSHWCRSLYGVFSEAGELLDYIEKGGISDEISHHGQA